MGNKGLFKLPSSEVKWGMVFTLGAFMAGFGLFFQQINQADLFSLENAFFITGVGLMLLFLYNKNKAEPKS